MSAKSRTRAERHRAERKAAPRSAIQRSARQSPYKMRLVADEIRHKNVNDALAYLAFSKKHAAVQIAKTLRSAVCQRRARGPRGQHLARRRCAVCEADRGQRRAEAQAVQACRHGTRHADCEADEPHRDRNRRTSWEGSLMGQKTHPVGFRLAFQGLEVALLRGA